MKLCDYGCGQEAKHQLKNGKWCCSKSHRQCPVYRKKASIQMKGKNTYLRSEEHKKKLSEAHKGKSLSQEHKKKISEAKRGIPRNLFSKEHKKKLSEAHKGKSLSTETKRRMSKSQKGISKGPCSEETKRKMSKAHKFTIEQIKERYPFFSKIEEMRYEPDKPKEKEIQVHCKNHECKNSKEKDGWFTPTLKQITDRKDNLENEGEDKSYFYCSQHCKDTCILYNLQSDPYKENNKPYTSTEKEVFDKLVLKRDKELCYYCGEHATDVHHLRPQKLEPFFALDPDYAISCCEKHHYKYGHPTGSEHSTGNLAKIVCSVESQKFLNQARGR
jgi:hypothetical protein